jgi:hypothetical protein
MQEDAEVYLFPAMQKQNFKSTRKRGKIKFCVHRFVKINYVESRRCLLHLLTFLYCTGAEGRSLVTVRFGAN